MLDQKKTKGIVKLGTTDSSGGMVVTHKQGTCYECILTEVSFILKIYFIILKFSYIISLYWLAFCHQGQK